MKDTRDCRPSRKHQWVLYKKRKDLRICKVCGVSAALVELGILSFWGKVEFATLHQQYLIRLRSKQDRDAALRAIGIKERKR